MTTLTSFQKTDLVDDHVAADYNRLVGAVLRAEFVNTETITATKELADADCQLQVITPSGADRTVELSPESTTNHVTIILNAGSTYNVLVKDDSGAVTFCTLVPGAMALFMPIASSWKLTALPRETDYKITPSVVSNDLVLTLTHADGTTPSTSRPLWININNTWRKVTAATSCTLADGTNWFNAGSSELATKEIDYFAYAVWDSNSSVVAVAPARIPYGRLVSDFSATTTNEKYLGNYANYTATDDVAVIGRFAATLSAGAGYTWTVPTFTNLNLVQYPIYETRRLTYVPTITGFSGTPTVGAARYQVVGQRCRLDIDNISGTSNLTTFTVSAPFSNGATSSYEGAAGFLADNSVGVTGAGRVDFQTSTATINLYKDMSVGAWTNSGTKQAYFNAEFFLT